MKPSLQLTISQNLTMTPQLQQAIKLLQLSTLDLQQEIQHIIDSNPMLDASTPAEDKNEPSQDNKETVDEFADFQWAQLYSGSNKTNNFNEFDYNLENLYTTTTSLQDHLYWQLGLTPMSDVDRVIAMSIIDAIDDSGFLTQSLTELQKSFHSDNCAIDQDEIEAVRHRIQQFDPIGCGSYHLSECLLVQLKQLSDETDCLDLTREIVKNHLELLGQHNYRQLKKDYHVDDKAIQQVLNNIHQLNPKPGHLIHQNITEYVIPDVNVKKVNGKWQVTLNQNILPQLSINQHYASLIQRANDSTDNQFLKSNLQEARWLLKSIQSRQDTLFKVANCIVAHQKDFFEHGEEAMKPLILNDIATILDMHESTISRATTQKFMHPPRGVFELKYFFSSHVNTVTGGECSSTAVRAVIKKLIAAENRRKPLSDNKITLLIKSQGIDIARRTVAKYREALGIPPSNERKMLED